MTFKFPPPFCGFPKTVLKSHQWAQMSVGAKGVYVVLCGMSDERSTRRFELKDEYVVHMAGVSRGTLNAARKELFKMGMVVCDREPGGRFTYTLCNPKTGRPFPGDPRAKVAYEEESPFLIADPVDEKPTALPVVSAVTIAPAFSTKSTDTLPKSMGDACEEGLEFCDTSFEFGWNITPQPTMCDYNPFSDNKRGAVFV
jgi:hypothetical protein